MLIISRLGFLKNGRTTMKLVSHTPGRHIKVSAACKPSKTSCKRIGPETPGGDRVYSGES